MISLLFQTFLLMFLQLHCTHVYMNYIRKLQIGRAKRASCSSIINKQYKPLIGQPAQTSVGLMSTVPCFRSSQNKAKIVTINALGTRKCQYCYYKGIPINFQSLDDTQNGEDSYVIQDYINMLQLNKILHFVRNVLQPVFNSNGRITG